MLIYLFSLKSSEVTKHIYMYKTTAQDLTLTGDYTMYHPFT